MQDKEGKVSYLQKIIDYISTTLSEPVAAKPAKVPNFSQTITSKFHPKIPSLLNVGSNMVLQIVAGLEPEATNLFLQMLARAATGQQQASTL